MYQASQNCLMIGLPIFFSLPISDFCLTDFSQRSVLDAFAACRKAPWNFFMNDTAGFMWLVQSKPLQGMQNNAKS